MRTIKLLLSFIFVAFSLLLLIIVHGLTFSSTSEREPYTLLKEGFHFTEYSGSGSVYVNNEALQPGDLKTSTFQNDLDVRSDEQTSLEFIFEGYFITALPGSRFRYFPKTRHLFLQKGDYYWEKRAGQNPVGISLQKPENLFYLSSGGRMRTREGVVEIWNYSSSGGIEFNIGGSQFQLKPRHYFLFDNTKKPQILPISPAPESISPEQAPIRLGNTGEQQVQFTWKNVASVRQYLWRLYSSRLREKVIESQVVEGNELTINLLSHSDYNQVFWDVCALNADQNLESVPSQLGVLSFFGVLTSQRIQARPPELSIQSITVSGNMVLIKGTASADAQLSIDDAPVKIDSEGKFIHTIFYPAVGVKVIVVHALSPEGLSTTIRKQVTVYDESL